MKTPKQIIERNLPLSEKYTLLKVVRGSILEGQCTTCQNCGKLISNMATVINSKGEHFTVGLDCVDTLTGIRNTENWEMEKYSFNKTLRFLSIVSLPDAKVWDNEGFIYYAEGMNSKGKLVKADTYGSDLKKYVPEWNELIKSKYETV